MEDIFGYDDKESTAASTARQKAESTAEQSVDGNAQIDYEQKSYGKIGYKRVQKLRKKGERRNIKVPKLCYELHKPEKPRVAFLVVAVLSIVMLVGVVVATVFLFNELAKLSEEFNGLGDVFKAVFNPTALMASLGMSVLPALVIVLAYAMLFALFIIPICIGLYLYSFVRNAFYLAKCSKEEFAKGGFVGDRIRRLTVISIAATFIWIAGLVFLNSAAGKLILSFVFIAVAIVVGGLLAILLVEKKKDEKWFETLEEYQKQNYLAHEGALRSVKKKLDDEKAFRRSFFK